MSTPSSGRKKFEADILEEWIARAKAQKQAPRPLKGRMPRVTGMQSPRQRRAERQTKDPVRAVYGPENQMNRTPIRPDAKGLTREVGPNDEHNDRDYRTGKDTRDRNPAPTKRARAQVPAAQSQRAPATSLKEFIARKGK